MSSFEQAIASLTDKNGARIRPILEDMRDRENPVLVVNLAGGDGRARADVYVAEHHGDIVAAGIAALARAGNCAEIIIYSEAAQTDGADSAARADAGGVRADGANAGSAGRAGGAGSAEAGNADGTHSADGADSSLAYVLAAAIQARAGDIPITARSGPASPVLRDETALFTVMDTGVIRVNRAEQDYNRTFLSYGYQGRPTLVIDGETAYQAGRLKVDPDAPLTKLVFMSTGDAQTGDGAGSGAGAGQAPGALEEETGGGEAHVELREVPVGTPLAELPGDYSASSPLLIGGALGRFIGGGALADTHIEFTYEFDSIRILTEKDCVISELAGIYRSARELSCAKCVMCREGSWQLAAIFSDIESGRSNRDDIALIEDICPIIRAGALCVFGKNMVLPAMTAVAEYRAVFEKHVIGRSCPAGKCRGLMKYIIDPSLCTGCGDCADTCPEEAIDGKDGFIHVIDEKLCENCGKCVEFCPEHAIKTDSGTIRVPKKPVKAGRFI